MTRLFLDTETYCALGGPADLGTYRYAENAEILLVTYAIDDGPVRCWDVTVDSIVAQDLIDALDQADEVIAHNAMFDRNVLRLGNLKIDVPIERWRCTMIQALVHALPGSLDELGRTLGLPQEQQKIKEGRKLIQRFCKPAPKNHKADRYDRHTHPDEWQRFIRYAVQDVEAMREIHRRLPTWNWNDDTVAEWHLDQRINDRGFAVDRELVDAGVRAAVVERRRIAERFAELTDGLAPSQREKVRRFLNDKHGLGLEQTAKHVMAPIAADDRQPAEVREIASLMLASNKTSTAKYKTIRDALSDDGRFRGGLQFAGASRTRRWAGRTFQPQNLPSRGIPKPHVIEQYIEALKADCHDLLFDDLMLLGAAALRGVVIAPDGDRLYAADLSNIEGRGLAFLAGEEWKLKAFRAFDAGRGPDLYNITATSIIGGDPYAVAKADRNVFGKVPDLALGYEGGAGALQTFCKGYGVKMADHWGQIRENVDARFVERAESNYEDWGLPKAADMEIDRTEWVASEAVKLAWRDRHSATVKLWRDTKDAAINAIRNPGKTFRAGPHLRIGVRDHGGNTYLIVKLPSGRYLVYFDPALTDDGAITYMGMGNEDGGTAKVWCRLYTYGGKLCIAGGTPVLTQEGWVPIEDIEPGEEVWDGVEWVPQDGPVMNGHRRTIEAHGVRMTPDHQVLTEEGWKDASQSERHHRAACRLPDGPGVRWQRWEELPVARRVRVRAEQDHRGFRADQNEEPWHRGVVRVHAAGDHGAEEQKARHVEAPGLRGLVLDARSLLPAIAPGLQELRRAWDRGLRSLARFVRGVLGGHGAFVPAWAHARPNQQRFGLLQGELPLGGLQDAGPQHPQEPGDRNPSRADDRHGSIRTLRHRVLDDSLPRGSRVAGRAAIRSARRTEPVYDLVNCGPRSRFVVRDKNGQPLIVHNCENAVQALARDILAANMPAIEAAGYRIVLTVHDEVIAEAPADAGVVDLIHHLATVPSWAEGLQLAAAGFAADRYRKD